jgi:hypothetical protein
MLQLGVEKRKCAGGQPEFRKNISFSNPLFCASGPAAGLPRVSRKKTRPFDQVLKVLFYAGLAPEEIGATKK